MEEVWLSPKGYEGYYLVSNLGRVRGLKRGAILEPVPSTDDYRVVSLSRENVVTTHRVHVLVLTTFCGEKPFENAQAAHNDGDKSNNKLTNLRWASPVENQADVDRHGRRCRGEDVYGAVLTEGDVIAIRARIKSGERNRPISEDFGVSISTVHLIRHNKIWRHV